MKGAGEQKCLFCVLQFVAVNRTFQNFLKIEENADGRHENFVFFSFFLNIAINNSELLFAINKKH
jgi:hypothetical protein